VLRNKLLTKEVDELHTKNLFLEMDLTKTNEGLNSNLREVHSALDKEKSEKNRFKEDVYFWAVAAGFCLVLFLFVARHNAENSLASLATQCNI